MTVLAKQPPTTPQPGPPQRGGGLRLAFATVLGVLAVLLTGFSVWVGIDLLSHEYVEGEVLVVEVVLGTSSLLALYGWVGAILLFWSSRGTSPVRPMLAAGLVATPICVVAAMVLPPVLSLAAVGLAVGVVALTLVRALRP